MCAVKKTDQTEPSPDAPLQRSGSGASAQRPKRDRNAILAVTVFPAIVIVAAVLGFCLPATFTPITPIVPYLLGLIMFLMGITLTGADFKRIAKRPLVVLLGLVAHYVIMPLAGLLVVWALQLPAELAVGVILVGCAPSGTASNVMTYLAKGDVAFSVSVATVSTLVAPLLMPLLTLAFAGQYMSIPVEAMFLDILKTVLLPVIAGVIVRSLFGRIIDYIKPVLPWLSAIAIATIVTAVMGKSAAAFAQAGLLIILAVVLHNGIGLLLGYLAGRAVHLDHAARRALAFEVGMQNSGLAASLATVHFNPAAALAPAVFSVWHNISGALVAAWLARKPIPTER